uniref:Uncharacterized protein n=1 Tax=Anguilla anguilla TaxID=7936 RepID=A0A0E9R576_ANGAN
MHLSCHPYFFEPD